MPREPAGLGKPHPELWKPPYKGHGSYSSLLKSLRQAQHEVSAFVQACKDVEQELKFLKALMLRSLVKSLVNNMWFV